MPHYALSALLSVALLSARGLAQGTGASPPVPLASKHFKYPDEIPYQVDTDNLVRGRQFGYNKCNSTTEGPGSLCQTAFVNSIDDFCLWAPSKPDSLIADTEGEEVAWCTKKGRGTRLIPADALLGVQLIQTSDYIQVVGFIDQTKIDLKSDDSGGELDPHGADARGNPLGGLMYSNGFPSNGGKNDTFQQVIEWNNFMGGGGFCIKVCDPAGKNAASLCEHRYDRIGCAYNSPNAAKKGVFEKCQGENQDVVGIYTSNGQVQTYTQPPESLGPITTIPYTARIPASSNCVSFESSKLYAGLPTASGASATAGATGKPGAATGSKGSSGPSPTGASGAGSLVASSLASLIAVVLSVVIFA